MTAPGSAAPEPAPGELDDALPHGIPEDILQEAFQEGSTGGDPPDPDHTNG